MKVKLYVDTETNMLSYETYEEYDYEDNAISGFCNYSDFCKQNIQTFIDECIEDYNENKRSPP